MYICTSGPACAAVHALLLKCISWAHMYVCTYTQAQSVWRNKPGWTPNVQFCCWCGKSPALPVRTKHCPWRCSSKERSRLVLYPAFDMLQYHFHQAALHCLVSQDLVAKLSDFRLSGERSQGDKRNTKLPVRWMAPEMLQEKSCPSSVQTDVWWVHIRRAKAVHTYTLMYWCSSMWVGCRYTGTYCMCLNICGGKLSWFRGLSANSSIPQMFRASVAKSQKWMLKAAKNVVLYLDIQTPPTSAPIWYGVYVGLGMRLPTMPIAPFCCLCIG